MAKQNTLIAAFNRGRVSPLAAARVEDIKRVALSAERMTNWDGRTLGAMSLRRGLGYLHSTKSDAQAMHIPFVYSTSDVAMLELTNLVMRVNIDDQPIVRVAVSSAVTNGAFDANVVGWTDADEAGATSDWVAGGYLSLAGTGSNAAIRTQQVTVAAGDQGDEHALRIVIKRGPVTLRVGSTSGADDYIGETELKTGTHSLAFTPSGNFHIHLSNRRAAISLLDSINVEGAGTVEIPTPWVTADLQYVRFRNSQSADVIFVACRGYQQRRIERRSTRSWSVVLYQPEDGPFRVENTGPITIAASAITGDVTLTASASLFRSTHAPSANSAGALFRLTSQGQRVSADIGAQNTFTNAIRVTGVGSDRTFTIVLAGTWVATVTLQRSLDSETGPWSDVAGKTWTANTTETYADGLDNQIVWYRIGVKTSDYGSGTVEAELSIAIGSITGVVQITAFSTSVSVSARVITDLGGTAATAEWREGLWSDYRGWPSAGCLMEGRIWWFGKGWSTGSVSDAFESFNPDTEGDSGPIVRSIGSGPSDEIAWGLPLQRLIIGTQGAEVSCRSSALDEPLTPTAFNPKDATTQGSALVAADKIDSRGVFVQRSGIRLYELAYDASVDANDYSLRELTLLCPEFGEPGIVQVVVQRQPETRLHCRRSDGTVGIAIIDKAENVLCLVDVETDGDIEDIALLPGSAEDRVYYTVQRTIGGVTKRYYEKFALASECQGGTLNKQLDSFGTFTSTAGTTFVITGADHLEGKEVAVWADGTDRSPGNPDEDDGQLLYTVTGGRITVTEGAGFTSAVYGLPYTAQWENAQTALAMAMGTSVLQPKNIGQLGLLLRYTHAKGIKYGPDFTHLSPMPDVEDGKVVAYDTVHETYNKAAFAFDGEWNTDSRLCLQAQAPRPATVVGAVISTEGVDAH